MTTWTTIVDGVPVATTTTPQTPITWETISGESSSVVQTNLEAHINDTTGAHASSAISFLQAGTSATARTAQDKLRESVNVTDFGASPSVTDTVNKAAFEAATNYCIANNKKLRIPAGIYEYSGWDGLTTSGITIEGDGSDVTTLKYTGSGNALLLGNTTAYTQELNLKGFSVEGNFGVTAIIRARALARSQWSDINVREANKTSGIGFVFQGCMLSRFDSLMCSQDRQAMTNPPEEGINIEALSPFGNSANNVFTSCYFEGAGNVADTVEVGCRISGGTQNTFIGGSAESCGTWGLLLDTDCQYNTFIGMGFENLAATGGDVADGGVYNAFYNCYASEKFILQGRSAVVRGGLFERIQIDALAERNQIEDVTVNAWATVSGGLADSGTGTKTKNIYDADAAAFLTDIAPRFLGMLDASAANQTGAGTLATVAFVQVFDDANNFDGTTFTAPVAGRYQLSATVSFDALSTAATLAMLEIVTSNRTFHTENGLNPKTGGLQASMSLSVLADMDSGDTAIVKTAISGMAGDTVTILGNAATVWTSFSGFKS